MPCQWVFEKLKLFLCVLAFRTHVSSVLGGCKWTFAKLPIIVKIVLESGWAETLILGDDDADTHIYQYHVLWYGSIWVGTVTRVQLVFCLLRRMHARCTWVRMRYEFSVVVYLEMVLRRVSGWRNADVDAEVQRQDHERPCWIRDVIFILHVLLPCENLPPPLPQLKTLACSWCLNVPQWILVSNLDPSCSSSVNKSWTKADRTEKQADTGAAQLTMFSFKYFNGT